MTDTPTPEPTEDATDITEIEVIEDHDVEVVPADVETRAEVPPTAERVYKGSGFRWSFPFGILLSLIVIILVFQNFESTTFQFLTWSIEAPLAVIILGSVVIAVVIDEIVGVVWRARRRRLLQAKAELKELKRQAAPPKKSRFGR